MTLIYLKMLRFISSIYTKEEYKLLTAIIITLPWPHFRSWSITTIIDDMCNKEKQSHIQGTIWPT